jgi:hypothetical protein
MKAKVQEEKNNSLQASGGDVRPCTCPSKFQDATYGVGNRAANKCKDGMFRCTVCGNKSK